MEAWTLLMLYGALGTGHCFAMCGGFALMATANATSRSGMWGRMALYLAGKTTTYLFLVFVLGAITGWVDESWWQGRLSPLLGSVAGLAMIAFGLVQGYRWWASRRARKPYRQPGEDGCRVNGKLRLMRNPASALVLGWVNGFVPCGFLWVALIYLSQWNNPVEQAIGVLVFSFVTTPGLLAAMGLFRWLGTRGLRFALPATSLALLLFGAILFLNASGWLPGHGLHALAPFGLANPDACDLGCCTPVAVE